MIYPFKTNDGFVSGADCDFFLRLGRCEGFHNANGQVQELVGVVAHTEVRAFRLQVNRVTGQGCLLAGVVLHGFFRAESGQGLATDQQGQLPELLDRLVEPQDADFSQTISTEEAFTGLDHPEDLQNAWAV